MDEEEKGEDTVPAVMGSTFKAKEDDAEGTIEDPKERETTVAETAK